MRERKARKRRGKTLPLMTRMVRIYADQETNALANQIFVRGQNRRNVMKNPKTTQVAVAPSEYMSLRNSASPA
jgi:hypothetical protein